MDRKEWTELGIFVVIVVPVVLVGALFIHQTMPAARAARVRTAIAANEAAVRQATVEEPDSAFNAGSESTANMLIEAAALLMDEDLAEMQRLDGLGWSDEDQADLEAFLAYKARVYELLMLASAMPPADFGMVTQKSPGVVEMLPHFRRLLRLEARTLAVNGRPDSADKVLGASVALARAVLVQRHPSVVRKSVGIAKDLEAFRAYRARVHRTLFPAPDSHPPVVVGNTPGGTTIRQELLDDIRSAYGTAPSAGARNADSEAARRTDSVLHSAIELHEKWRRDTNKRLQGSER
jgi:hypothetical protein